MGAVNRACNSCGLDRCMYLSLSLGTPWRIHGRWAKGRRERKDPLLLGLPMPALSPFHRPSISRAIAGERKTANQRCQRKVGTGCHRLKSNTCSWIQQQSQIQRHSPANWGHQFYLSTHVLDVYLHLLLRHQPLAAVVITTAFKEEVKGISVRSEKSI